jgi:hypothetical protein
MALTVLKPSGPNGDPFVALKAKLGKAVFTFKVGLVAMVNMLPPVGNIYAVEWKVMLAVFINQRFWRLERRGRQTDPSAAHTGIPGNDDFQVAGSGDRLLGDCLCTV